MDFHGVIKAYEIKAIDYDTKFHIVLRPFMRIVNIEIIISTYPPNSNRTRQRKGWDSGQKDVPGGGDAVPPESGAQPIGTNPDQRPAKHPRPPVHHQETVSAGTLGRRSTAPAVTGDGAEKKEKSSDKKALAAMQEGRLLVRLLFCMGRDGKAP